MADITNMFITVEWNENCPSDSFLGIGYLVFSETLHGSRGPCRSCVHAGVGYFFEKSRSCKNDQKWSKMARNRVFGLFRKTKSLGLSGNCVKLKFLWTINILQKLHA